MPRACSILTSQTIARQHKHMSVVSVGTWCAPCLVCYMDPLPNTSKLPTAPTCQHRNGSHKQLKRAQHMPSLGAKAQAHLRGARGGWPQ